MNRYVYFNEVPNEGKKTKKCSVTSKDGYHLGFIKFWSAWRQYTFHPNEDTLFDTKCLREITSELERMNTEIKAEWARRRKQNEV